MAVNWEMVRFDPPESEIDDIRERMRVRQRLIRYSPDQERGDHGKFSEADGGTPSKADQETSKKIGAAKDTKHSGDPATKGEELDGEASAETVESSDEDGNSSAVIPEG